MSSPPRRPSPGPRSADPAADAGPTARLDAGPAAGAPTRRRGRARAVVAASGRVASTQRQAFRDARSTTGQVGPDGRLRRPPRRRPYWLDPATWAGSLVIMAGITAVLYVVQAINAADSQRLDRFGLQPRHVSGLWGVLTMPFLHASWHHLLSNTAPFVLIGWVVLAGGLRTWAITTGLVVLVGGLLTWAVGPSDTTIVGASALVFGWLGYLLARAFFQPRLRWILAALITLVFFGTLLYGLVPAAQSSHVSWQAHVCGFAVGLVSGAVLHPRRGFERRRPLRRSRTA